MSKPVTWVTFVETPKGTLAVAAREGRVEVPVAYEVVDERRPALLALRVERLVRQVARPSASDTAGT